MPFKVTGNQLLVDGSLDFETEDEYIVMISSTDKAVWKSSSTSPSTSQVRPPPLTFISHSFISAMPDGPRR